ncbi:hypothetical protein NIES267_37350 [Calothrix parasitica NIES-267]|uniref:Uncharacterized protein n=1 Tax=Calothrix parasitica NIES-267 TaxID=1973488 RepID=A0A1Z4LSL8_9CYAN|nr:hypothetical protein NIES267_37350 [Calothrix parasitica NIES-267]
MHGKRLGVIATSEASLHQAMILRDWGDDIVVFTNNLIPTWAISDGVTAGIFTHQSLLRPQNPYSDKHSE